MKLRNIIFTLFILQSTFYLVACSAPDKVGSLDLVQWRNDRGGCSGKRMTLLKDFEKSESALLAKHIDNVTKILGRPDIFQLGGRDTKFYIYFLETGTHCQAQAQTSVAKRVTLKFNAVGLLSQIRYGNE